jgi:glyoxylase-like metal-dependent hydrolase (beta-lactamase superfamily II)
MKLLVKTFVAPGFGENAYVVWGEGARECAVIDPGGAVDDMLELVEVEQLTVGAILLTHAHLDHIEGVAQVVRATNAPVYLHSADRFLYERVAMQAQAFGMRVAEQPPVDHPLQHGQAVVVGDVTYAVRHVPGHSPGHVLLYVEAAQCAFVGDIVFQGSIGRTDLPGGDFTQLISGIREQVLSLPAETVLYTGHGPPTTAGHEAATNPFLIPHYGGGLA